jgi:hypothetical protein
MNQAMASLWTLFGELPAILAKPIRFGGQQRLAKRKELASKCRARAAGSAFSLEGLLEPGIKHKFAIKGEEFEISEDTWVFGILEFGAHVTVKGREPERGQKHAGSIVVNRRAD